MLVNLSEMKTVKLFDVKMPLRALFVFQNLREVQQKRKLEHL